MAKGTFFESGMYCVGAKGRGGNWRGLEQIEGSERKAAGRVGAGG